MKLNWRKIVFIVLFAELLMVYWNSLGGVQTKKQPSVKPVATRQPAPNFTKIEPWSPNDQTDTEMKQAS